MNLRMLNRNTSLAETLASKQNEPSLMKNYHGKKIYVYHSPQSAGALGNTGSFQGRVPRSLDIGGVSFPYNSNGKANHDLGP